MPKQERGCAGFSEREDEDIYFLHKINSGDPRAKGSHCGLVYDYDTLGLLMHPTAVHCHKCRQHCRTHVFYILSLAFSRQIGGN